MTLPLLGQTFLNQYLIEEFVALTPLGELYRASDTRSNKPLALTLLPKKIYENPEFLKSLETESVKLRGISHPNLVPYLGLFQTPTLAFLLEEWIDGPSLNKVIEKAPLTIAEILTYAKALCYAMEALHRQNYLHLHLGPELIHINKEGRIFLGGIASARQMGGGKEWEKWGNYPRIYFSPEQLVGQATTSSSDIYALTVLTYQLTTGAWINGKHAPKTDESIKRTHLDVIPSAPISLNREIPDHFSRMILWALRKNPEDRLKTTTELLSSLALAANVSVDEIPKTIQSVTAPITANILKTWKFLPPPKSSIINQNVPPLEDRLLEMNKAKSRKGGLRIGVMSVFIFLMMAGFVSLFWFVHPAPGSEIPTPVKNTPFAANYTPPPTLIPLPRPTDPNGGRIAFTCTRGEYNQLCMINRDGTGLTQLSDMDASNYYPTFSPQGSSLLFASNRNGPFDLYLLLFGEKELIQISENVGNVISPDYSPDGLRIVFANRPSDGPTSIWMVNADGLNPHLVYAGKNTIVATAWSPDGEKIAYAMSLGVPQEYEIFTMDPNGKNHVRISQGLKGIGGSIDWSPDSKSLLIYAGAYGDKDIYKIEVADGSYTQITNGGNNAGASYSPDGLYIVFNSLRNDDQADLYIMRANGFNQVQLTNNPEPDWGAQWTW